MVKNLLTIQETQDQTLGLEELRKIPWRRKWQPTPVFLPGEFHGQRRLADPSPWGHKESDTSKQLTVSLLFTCHILSCCCHCCSVAKMCLTLQPYGVCSMPGSLALHCLLEFAHIQVHWVSDAIYTSHPLPPPSPFAFNLSQHQGLFQWVSSSVAMFIHWRVEKKVRGTIVCNLKVLLYEGNIRPCSKIAMKLSSWQTGRTWKGVFPLNPWWWLSRSSKQREGFAGRPGLLLSIQRISGSFHGHTSIRACDSPGPRFPSGSCGVSLHPTPISSYKASHTALVCGTGPSPDSSQGKFLENLFTWDKKQDLLYADLSKNGKFCYFVENICTSYISVFSEHCNVVEWRPICILIFFRTFDMRCI